MSGPRRHPLYRHSSSAASSSPSDALFLPVDNDDQDPSIPGFGVANMVEIQTETSSSASSDDITLPSSKQTFYDSMSNHRALSRDSPSFSRYPSGSLESPSQKMLTNVKNERLGGKLGTESQFVDEPRLLNHYAAEEVCETLPDSQNNHLPTTFHTKRPKMRSEKGSVETFRNRSHARTHTRTHTHVHTRACARTH